MAETIGRAYVKILADGTGLGKDVEKELRKHEGAFEGAGDRNGTSYSKAFDAAVKRSPTWANLTKSLNKSVAEANVTHNFFEGPAWKNLVDDMERVHGPELADKLRTSFEKEFRAKGSLQGLEDSVADTTRRLSGIIEADFKATERRIAEAARKAEAETRRALRSTEREAKTFSQKFARTFDSVADSVGRAFGKGSRNDFLNIVGSMISGLTKLAGVFAKTFINLGSMFVNFFVKKFVKGADDVTTAAEEMGAEVTASVGGGIASTVATGGATLVAGLVAIAIAAEAVAVSAGVMAAALSLAAGAIVALASTVAFAAASIAAVAPLLIPVAAIIGGIVASVYEFQNATGALKTSMDKVRTAGKSLFATFRDRAFQRAPELTDKIAEAMKSLDPLLTAAGKGFNRFAGIVVDSLTSPAFQQFADRFQRFLPSAMARLGEAFANTFEGLAGLLRGLIPAANRLLDWINQITQKFSDWANSAAGQNQIADFMERAGDSARVLGNFLLSAWHFLTNLLSAGKDTGDSLFQSMADQLQHIADWIQQHPETVKKWFSDAKTFAETLGGAITDLIQGFDKLDTPENRVWATKMVEVIGKVIEGIMTTISWASKLAIPFLTAAEFIVQAFGKIQSIVLGTIGVILTGLNKLPFGVGGVSDEMLRHFNDFKDGATKDVQGVADSIGDMKRLAEAGADLHLDTSGASAAVASLSAQVDALLAKARASPKSPTAVEHGVQQGGQPSSQGGTTSDDTRAPHANRIAPSVGRAGVIINVSTPTKDPVGVANETVNRLVGIGYAT